MTRDKARQELWKIGGLTQSHKADVYELINKIYYDFEIETATSEKTCKGCIHKPDIGEDYKQICGECSRFYSDNFKDE